MKTQQTEAQDSSTQREAQHSLRETETREHQHTEQVNLNSLENGSKSDDTDEDGKPEPPDGGWGWMVTLGAFVITFCLPILGPSFGILFSRQLLDWHTSSTTIAIILNLFMLVVKLTGVVVGSLTREFGFRRIAMVGTLLISLSLTLAAFATSPTVLLVFFSLGCGLGAGLSAVGILLLSHYFKKRRGRAHAIHTSGASVGRFLIPLLIDYLQQQYSIKGATMIVGAITFHSFFGATLFQPVKWHMKYPQGRPQPEQRKLLSLSSDSDYIKSTTSVSKSAIKAGKINDALPRTQGNENRLSTRPRQHQMSECSHISVTSDFELEILDTVGSMRSVNSQIDENLDAAPMSHNCRGYFARFWQTLLRLLHSISKDLSILRKPSALIIALASTLVANSHNNFNLFMAFAVQAAGHPLRIAALCLTAVGIGSFVLRLVVATLFDFSWFNVRLAHLFGICLMTSAMMVFTFLSDEVLMIVTMAVWGSGLGMYQGLNQMQMLKIFGVTGITSMFGANNLLVAFGFCTIGPLVGFIRDTTGSYLVSLWVLAGLMGTASLLLLLLPAALAYEQRHQEI